MAVVASSSKDIKEKKSPTLGWINRIYDPNLLKEDELLSIYENVKYQGFDRSLMLQKLEDKVKNPKLAIEIILACSIRGPIQAAKIKLSDGKTIDQHGIPGSGKKGTEDLSCARVSASTADIAAYYMKKLDVPARIIDTDLPAWLQFPTAGSIKLPDKLRKSHIEFSRKFSILIGGKFDDSIYAQMMNNAYLEPKLRLFDEN
jgi:hypothetical protein